jgi:hypothetical protein
MYSVMKKKKYLQYITTKYKELSAQYLFELFKGKNFVLLKALNSVLTTLAREKSEYEDGCKNKKDSNL